MTYLWRLLLLFEGNVLETDVLVFVADSVLLLLADDTGDNDSETVSSDVCVAVDGHDDNEVADDCLKTIPQPPPLLLFLLTMVMTSLSPQ